MGVIVNKKEETDELSQRIKSDLRVKAIQQAERDDVDLAEDAEYMKDLKKTGKFGWIWIVLIVGAILSIISIIFM